MIPPDPAPGNDSGRPALPTTCPRCGAVAARPLRWQTFADRSRHIRTGCASCGAHWYVVQSAPAVAAADANPPFGERPAQPSLFDADGGEG